MRNLAGLLAAILVFVAARHAVAVSLDVRVSDAAGGPLSDAVVYALPPSGGGEVRGKKVVAIEQADREFVPYVSVIQVGTAVTFPNRDPILHHVYSFSPAKPFEIKLYGGKSPTEVVFDRAGVVALGCNIHDWMIGYILVVPTAYFAKSEASGIARLRDLPPGTYEIRAWHPQQKSAPPNQSIAVESNPRIAFAIEVVPRKTKYKPPLDRLRY